MIGRRYPRWVLWLSCLLLVVANVFNIAADLGGMADAMQMVTGVTSAFWCIAFAGLIISLLFWTSYKTIAKVFKWLTLTLFAYIITAFLTHPNWTSVLRATIVPHMEWSRAYVAILVAIFGTTISPYLFFWQAAQEVEEEREHGSLAIHQRDGATPDELKAARTDVFTGMFFSNLVMYFIILTTATTLHARGIMTIETAQQAAEALRPLAGRGAYLLFTLGLIGTGILAIPVLAGSCAYAIAEAANWDQPSLSRKPLLAPRFYGVIAASLIIGLALNYTGMNAVKMLFWSAVLNGVLAAPLVILVVILTSDRTVMGDKVNSPVLQFFGVLCAGVMTLAAVAIFL